MVSCSYYLDDEHLYTVSPAYGGIPRVGEAEVFYDEKTIRTLVVTMVTRFTGLRGTRKIRIDVDLVHTEYEDEKQDEKPEFRKKR